MQFLRKIGYTVTFHPIERETLIVNGKRAYIKLSQAQYPNRHSRWNPQPSYGFNRPMYNNQLLEYDNCYLVLMDRPNCPLYEVGVEGTPRSPQITADLQTRYPLKLIGLLNTKSGLPRKANPSMENWKKINRVNGTFAPTKGIDTPSKIIFEEKER